MERGVGRDIHLLLRSWPVADMVQEFGVHQQPNIIQPVYLNDYLLRLQFLVTSNFQNVRRHQGNLCREYRSTTQSSLHTLIRTNSTKDARTRVTSLGTRHNFFFCYSNFFGQLLLVWGILIFVKVARRKVYSISDWRFRMEWKGRAGR